jgi:carbonic anhydrase
MCELCGRQIDHALPARRSFLKAAAVTAASLTAASLASTPRAFAAPPKAPPKQENVLPPDAALKRLLDGNARYIAGTTQRHDFRHEREALSGGQNPFAAVLSCADSRIAPEFCFDTARGDVFVCRVAGNFATDEMVASLEYAVQVLNTPLIMVLGHEACGAVDATIKSIKDGTTLPGHLPSLVHALTPAVEAAQGQPGDLLANAIARNVAMNVDRLKSSTPILQSFVNSDKLHVVGGVYALKTGKVVLV